MITLPPWAIYILLGIQLADKVVSKVQEAEETFKEPGQGEAKKEFVKENIRTSLELAESMSTGGQKKTLGTVSLILDALDAPIDRLASILFPKK